MADWHIGQKVVCVNDEMSLREPGKTLLIKRGETYTIRSIFEFNGKIGLRLCELVNREFHFTRAGFVGEGAYLACRFRPLVSQDADISVFTEILNRVNERVPVKA